MGKYLTETTINSIFKTKKIQLPYPKTKSKQNLRKIKSIKKSVSSNQFDEKTESLLFQITSKIKQKLETLAQNKISNQQKKSLLAILRGNSNISKDFERYLPNPSQQFFTSIQNLVPQSDQFDDDNQTMNLISTIFTQSYIQNSTPQFLIYFIILLERFLEKRSEIKIKREDFKQLIKMIWNITEKYLNDNISVIENAQNFQAQWLILESFDFNLNIPIKQLFFYQVKIID